MPPPTTLFDLVAFACKSTQVKQWTTPGVSCARRLCECGCIPRGRASTTDFATAVVTVMVVPFGLVQESADSPEVTAGSDSVVAITSSVSASGCSSATSVNKTFCTGNSIASRSDFAVKLLPCPPQLSQRLRLLHHHNHVHQHLLYFLDGWYLVLCRNWDTHDPLSVLDVCVWCVVVQTQCDASVSVHARAP